MLSFSLLVLAFIALAIGFMSLSQATMGVGVLGIACFFVMLARIAQAAEHQKELKKLLEEPEQK